MAKRNGGEPKVGTLREADYPHPLDDDIEAENLARELGASSRVTIWRVIPGQPKRYVRNMALDEADGSLLEYIRRTPGMGGGKYRVMLYDRENIYTNTHYVDVDGDPLPVASAGGAAAPEPAGNLLAMVMAQNNALIAAMAGKQSGGIDLVGIAALLRELRPAQDLPAMLSTVKSLMPPPAESQGLEMMGKVIAMAKEFSDARGDGGSDVWGPLLKILPEVLGQKKEAAPQPAALPAPGASVGANPSKNEDEESMKQDIDELLQRLARKSKTQDAHFYAQVLLADQDEDESVAWMVEQVRQYDWDTMRPMLAGAGVPAESLSWCEQLHAHIRRGLK